MTRSGHVLQLGCATAVLVCVGWGLPIGAQQAEQTELPDAPSATLLPADIVGLDQGGGTTPNIAKKYATTIAPGQTAQPLSAGDKMAYALRVQVTPLGFASALFSAGYNHLNDSRPHFGTDKAGFGERLGNAALRRMTASVVGNGMIAPLLHEDPRYYRLGSSESIKHRAIYAASRIILTRTDDGKRTVNAAQLIGIAASQSLVQLYYPERDSGNERIISSTLSSYATSAGLYAVREFLPDITSRLRHKK